MCAKTLRISLLSIVVCFSCCDPLNALAQEKRAKPTETEIRKIEARVKLPHGATTLRKYVRYYFASDAKRGTRQISGIYISRFWLQPSAIPATGIVVAADESEIPVPADAECSVLTVKAAPESNTRVSAECSGGLLRVK